MARKYLGIEKYVNKGPENGHRIILISVMSKLIMERICKFGLLLIFSVSNFFTL